MAVPPLNVAATYVCYHAMTPNECNEFVYTGGQVFGYRGLSVPARFSTTVHREMARAWVSTKAVKELLEHGWNDERKLDINASGPGGVPLVLVYMRWVMHVIRPSQELRDYILEPSIATSWQAQLSAAMLFGHTIMPESLEELKVSFLYDSKGLHLLDEYIVRTFFVRLWRHAMESCLASYNIDLLDEPVTAMMPVCIVPSNYQTMTLSDIGDWLLANICPLFGVDLENIVAAAQEAHEEAQKAKAMQLQQEQDAFHQQDMDEAVAEINQYLDEVEQAMDGAGLP